MKIFTFSFTFDILLILHVFHVSVFVNMLKLLIYNSFLFLLTNRSVDVTIWIEENVDASKNDT